MKKYFIAIALLASGTILSNAAVVYTTVNTSAATESAQGNYYGFAANFTNAAIGGTSAEGGEAGSFASLSNTYLNELTLSPRVSGGSGVLEFKVAVYKYTADAFEFLTLSNESQTSIAGGAAMTFTFDSFDLGASNATYHFLFVTSGTTVDDLQSAGMTGYQGQSIMVGVSVARIPSGGSTIPGGSGTYKSNSLNSWEGQYIPKFELKTSDTPTIPEPSAFGLLVGLGTLAMVASRRRSRKVA